VTKVKKCDLDLAFSYNAETDEYVEAIAVLDDPWVILTRRDSAIASLDRPGFGVLDQLDLVAWTRRWRSQVELEDTWVRRGIAPKIVYRTDDNLALTWLEPHEPPAPRMIALCYPRHRPVTATARSLITAIRGQT
jgi:DNA-binding transcriptional LysR family regulator